jgi:hypothetical protein
VGSRADSGDRFNRRSTHSGKNNHKLKPKSIEVVFVFDDYIGKCSGFANLVAQLSSPTYSKNKVGVIHV